MSINCRTNSEGECTLKNVSEGKHTLTIIKDGYVTHTQEINVGDGQLDFNVTLEKNHGHTKNITFKLKDENGDNITIYKNQYLEIVDYEKDVAAIYEGKIDATGTVTINNIEYGHYKISIPESMGKYAYDTFVEELIVNDDTLDIMDLRIPYKRAEIHFTVKKGDDTGCQGLTVGVFNRDDTELIASAITGSAGGCNIKNLLYGVYRIKVYDASLDVENTPYYKDIITVNSQNINKNIVLEDYYTVTFVCGDLDSASRVLKVSNNDCMYAKHLPTNEQAYTTSLLLPNGTYSGEIIRDEIFEDWTGRFIVNENNITITTTGYEVRLNSFDNATGEKLGWCYISLHNDDWSVNYDGTTSAGGHLIFEHVPAGTYIISATHEGYNNYTENEFIVNEHTLNKEIRLIPNQ